MLLVLQDGVWEFLKGIATFLYNFALTLGGPGLFFIAIADSSFLSIPEGNDLLIVILSTGQTWERMAYLASMTIMGSVTGCLLLFSVGRRGGGFLARRMSQKRIGEFQAAYRKWGVWSILIPSLLPPPTPFKIFVLSAGMFKVSYSRFTVAVLIGRSVRYFMWGILAVLYGETARYFLEHNLKLVGVVLFMLLVTAILTYTLIWYKSRRNPGQEKIV